MTFDYYFGVLKRFVHDPFEVFHTLCQVCNSSLFVNLWRCL